MINYLPTLLLNEPASVVSKWEPSPEFTPLKLPGPAMNIHDALLPRSMTIAEKEHRVVQLLPLVLSPDFSYVLSGMDVRLTFDVSSPYSIADFFSIYPRGEIEGLTEVLSLDAVPRILSTSFPDDKHASDLMSTLRETHAKSPETVKQVSAVILSYILVADNLYRRSKR